MTRSSLLSLIDERVKNIIKTEAFKEFILRIVNNTDSLIGKTPDVYEKIEDEFDYIEDQFDYIHQQLAELKKLGGIYSKLDKTKRQIRADSSEILKELSDTETSKILKEINDVKKGIKFLYDYIRKNDKKSITKKEEKKEVKEQKEESEKSETKYISSVPVLKRLVRRLEKSGFSYQRMASELKSEGWIYELGHRQNDWVRQFSEILRFYNIPKLLINLPYFKKLKTEEETYSAVIQKLNASGWRTPMHAKLWKNGTLYMALHGKYADENYVRR